MTTAHLEKKMLKEAKGLSKNSLMEVIDFIQFLREKNKKKDTIDIKKDLYELSVSQTRHLEEEFTDYKKLYPSE